ncbi:hypothetical protein BH10PSE18_BH10PSE18_11880 [soil metagenome]
MTRTHQEVSPSQEVKPEVPPRVDYRMTPWGQALCPALDAILKWVEARGDGAATNENSLAKRG